MNKFILKAIVVFIMLLISSSLLVEFFNMRFGELDYFQKRGFFFLAFITVFPRLTLLFSSVVSGGVAWWLAFIFCPRILVAMLATLAYFKTNPLLVVISWLVALGGEAYEKKSVFVRYTPGPTKNWQTIDSSQAIEAEFTKKS